MALASFWARGSRLFIVTGLMFLVCEMGKNPHSLTVNARENEPSKSSSPALQSSLAPQSSLQSLAPQAPLAPQEMIASQVPIAKTRIEEFHSGNLGASERTLHIVYWTPSDRSPAPEYQERLTRVLRSVQGFYAKEMDRLGFGPRTFPLPVDDSGLVKIHLVKGEAPYDRYGVESGSRILQESIPVLEAAGVDASKETVVIFCNMSNWDPATGRITQNSPYYAGGGLRGGTAWQVDSPILDSDLLSDKTTMVSDGQYGRISLGKYNSIFVGGVCHELGHALGLPHNRERPDEARAFGTALMGSGNRTYGDELRGEGRGSFLTLGEGLRLASHPLFLRSDLGLIGKRSAEIVDLIVAPTDDARSIAIRGRVVSQPASYAVVAYMDPVGGSDYDATTVTAVPTEQTEGGAGGEFQLVCSALKRGSAGVLRLVVCTVGGGSIEDQTLSFPYKVLADGTVDLTAHTAKLALTPICRAMDSGNREEAERLLAGLSAARVSSRILEIGAAIVGGGEGEKLGPRDVQADEAYLSELKPSDVKLGYGRPIYNRLPERQGVLMAVGEVYGHGIYAHSVSSHSYSLGKQWSRLRVRAAIAEGRHGSCVFVVLGDGKELYRSAKLKDGTLEEIDLSVAGIDKLDLVVEDAGDGKSGDWGLWLDPLISK